MPAFTAPLRRRGWLIPLLLVLATTAIVTLLFVLRPAPPESQATEKTWPVQVTELTDRRHAPEIRLFGRVETPFQTTLTAAVTADVESLPVLEGQSVEQGEVIVRLDDRDVDLTLRQRQANVTELQSQIDQERRQHAANQQLLDQERSLVTIAKRRLEREQRLGQSDLSSQSQVDQARQALASARMTRINRELAVSQHEARMQALNASLERAKAQLEQARLDQQRTAVQAPFSGTVTDIAVSPGERVRPGEPLASLYGNDPLEVRAQLPMGQLSLIRQGLHSDAPLNARLTIDGAHYSLRLARLSGQVNAGAGGVDGFFRFRERSPALPLNQTLELTLTLPEQSGLFAVPVSAMYQGDTIYRVEEQRLRAVDVTVAGSRYVDGQQQRLVRSDALSAGDRILTTALPNAVEGLRVRIRNQAGDE
ncbi:hypothetical protein CF392_05350 [Tamilnaduibacter salinus]|uniref:Uncharacterized protein n=1 Tax=Tamilnaduibacter salinus TaxID=1484056 RepID=A0A2A2I6G8_9GAMM|nr:efflux RND transporter periplasmic adaptor subunit [Tamilnaduibacter salinus]PAV26633.1 hypothetical protein CF392_05350 [Tamilnaduibacter salinus]